MKHFFLLVTLLFFSCKNFLGNPHKKPLSSRIVPALHGELVAEPANWWVGMKHNQVEILFQRADIASYEVHLGKTKGVKLLKVEKGDNPNCLFITLEISPNAPPQKVPIVFSKGVNIFTHEFPIRRRTRSP